MMGVTIPNTIPVPGFLVAEIIESYETDPAALCPLATNAIKRGVRINSDVAQSQTNRNLAAYVPQWLFGLTVLRLKIQNGTAKSTGIATNKAAYTKRSREWSSRVHEQFLAVKARSLLPQISPQDDSNRDRDQAVRSLVHAMKQQAAKTTAATTPKNKGVNAFPLATQKMILIATQKDEHRRTRTEPTKQMQTMLMLDFPNVSFFVSHFHPFLRNKRDCAAQFPTGFCTAIKNRTFLEDFTDTPGTMSIFCFGPQTTSATNVKTVGTNPKAVAIMQLKLNDTSTGFSDKDIKP